MGKQIQQPLKRNRSVILCILWVIIAVNVNECRAAASNIVNLQDESSRSITQPKALSWILQRCPSRYEVAYSLSSPSYIHLAAYDIQGRQLAVVEGTVQMAGWGTTILTLPEYIKGTVIITLKIRNKSAW
jgi:hypothetical protein